MARSRTQKRRNRKRPPPRPRAEPSRYPEPERQYRVVELSTVDEASLERTLNEAAAEGWTLDGIQFAMRESSRRPSMAFVMLTREGDPRAVVRRSDPVALHGHEGVEAPRSRLAATQRLVELAGGFEDGEP